MKELQDLQQVFKYLSKNCNYLILRNYEGLFDDVCLEGHNDIDVLCSSIRDRRIMVKELNAEPRIGVDNGIHYKFLYNKQEIALDIRMVGDGYYDLQWQKNMLKNKQLDDRGFFVMSSEDYFMSLIYHAIYQKECLSEEYRRRLSDMAKAFPEYSSINGEQIEFENCLLGYMKEHHYYYTKPYDHYVVPNFNIDLTSDYIKYPNYVKVQHKRDQIKEYIFGKINGARVRIKNLIKKV